MNSIKIILNYFIFTKILNLLYKTIQYITQNRGQKRHIYKNNGAF